MGLRITGVKLVADYREYRRGVREAKNDTKGFKDELKDTRTEGDKLGEALGKAGKSSSKAVDEMRKTVSGLDDQISGAEKSLKDLAKAYASGGDSGIAKQMREQKRALSELKNARSLLPDADELAKIGASVGTRLIGGIRNSLSSVEPSALGIPALGLLLAPTLGAAISGAVVGGIGIGGVAGGIALAARDQRVKDSGKELGRFLLGDLERRASGFVEPTLKGIDRIRQGWAEMGPDLDKIFKSSRFVEPLADGLIKGAKGIVGGIADAIEGADPVINSFHNMFESIGTATGDLFRGMAQDADEGASAIDDLTGSIVNMIAATGGILHATAAVQGFGSEVDSVVDKGRYWLEDSYNQHEALTKLGVRLDLTADGFANGSVQAEAYRKATIGTATAADFATLKTAGMTDAQISGADASGKYRAQLDVLTATTQRTAAQMGTLVATEKDVQEIQKTAQITQTTYNKSIELMAPQAQRATMMVDGLKKATQLLYGAQEQAIDANESYEASWDSLSESVKKNKGSLDAHTAAGRANRDSLQALLTSSREMFVADVNSGMAIDDARKKHEKRTAAVREEARHVGLDKKGTDDLIKSYGRIPSDKKTDIIQSGVDKVVRAMMDLYVYQRSLAEGLPIGTVRAMLKDEKGPAKKYGGYHEGGWTGPGQKMEKAGDVHADEFVIKKSSRRKIEAKKPGLLSEMNATGQVPGYADGGWVGAFPVEGRNYRVAATGDRTKVPTREQVAAKVMPAFGGNWPSSPSAQRGDSGVWRSIKRFLENAHMGGSFGNGYRPGDPLWHGSGRAVDWMGYNQDALATRLAGMKPLELIHRSNKRDYAYTRGRNKGSFNEALMNAHKNHIHIAMKDGGVIREPVLGVGASGRSYSFGEGYRPERVVPMGSGTGAAGGVGTTTIVNVTANVAAGANPVEAGRQIAAALQPYLASGGQLRGRGGKTVLSGS